MTKRPSALLQSISEAQETEKIEKVKSSQEDHKYEQAESNHTPSPAPVIPGKSKKRDEKKRNLQKVSCYLRPDQVELWDEMTEELRMRMKKKKLDYKDIDRQVIVREIFDTISQDQIEQLLTAKRSNGLTV